MNKISCELCQDLMPLVKDGVASPDSRRAVLCHVEACTNCRQIFENWGLVEPKFDDKRVLARIKRQMTYLALGLLVVGALVGIGFSSSHLVFYNILIMPAVGALAYAALGKKAYSVPLAILPLTYIYHFVDFLLSTKGSGKSPGFPGALLATPLFWGLLYAGFAALGAIIAALLTFAFQGRNPRAE